MKSITPHKESLMKCLTQLDTITLDEMDQVKLMDRLDTKYWFNSTGLVQVLERVKNDYYILTIDNQLMMPYASTYFDTTRDALYTAHHNGKLNRYKVRRRTYLISGISYLEVKFKSNKGRTVKRRFKTEQQAMELSPIEKEFIAKETPLSVEDLQVSLDNRFQRIMLVNKNFNERCTIDLNLQYSYDEREVMLGDLVIVEIKSERGGGLSPIALALRDLRFKSAGFSKYCVGRTMTDPGVKQNAFKNKLRKINKIIVGG